MKKLLSLCLAVAAAASLFAQDEMDGPRPSKESLKYSEFRSQSVEPTWGLAKIKKIVMNLKEDEEMNRRVADKVFNSWSLSEKFTYTMIHGEDFSQNCDMMPLILDEHKKVFSYFPGVFGDESAWSQRQMKFMENNRSQVLDLMKQTILSKKIVGNNIKNAIWNLNGVELIPTLVSVYNKDKKDHDILTLMMLMMKDAKYPSFVKSSIYKKLYGTEENWRSRVMYSPELSGEVIRLANSFYKSKKLR